MEINLEQVRNETPGCAHVMHLNNAGAALMPSSVINAVEDYFTLESQIGGYETVEKRSDDLEKVYKSIATLLSAEPSEIAVVENATRAWDMAFYAIPFNEGDQILTCVSDYASNHIPFIQTARKTGAEIKVVPNDEYGQISLSALQEMINPKVKLIALTHIPTNGGLVNPAAEVGAIAKKHGILYLLDACQSAGQVPLSVEEIGCDMLSATSRKFLRGPRGMGFLYVRSNLIQDLEPPFLDLHAAKWTEKDDYIIRPDARRFENWETNYSAKIGLGAAVDYALSLGVENTWKRIQKLATELRTELNEIPKVTLHDLGEVQCGIVSFSLENWQAHALKDELRKEKINVSVANAEDTLLDMNERGLTHFIRSSVHYYNSEEELERFLDIINKLC